jgi:hypothetical protein
VRISREIGRLVFSDCGILHKSVGVTIKYGKGAKVLSEIMPTSWLSVSQKADDHLAGHGENSHREVMERW